MTHLHNVNSIAELRISELTLDLRLGPPKEVSELMKIRFGLITFYQRGFALLHSIQDSGEGNHLSIQCRLDKCNCDLLCH